MSDNTTEDAVEPDVTTPASRIGARFRKIAFALGVLLLIWAVFGQGIPRLVFKEPKHSVAPNISAPPAPSAVEEALTAAPIQPALETRITALEAKIDALQHAPTDESRLVQLEAQLAQQEKTMILLQTQLREAQSKSTQQLSLLTVFGQMKESIVRGEAFADALAQLKSLAQNRPNLQSQLAQLDAYAQSGVGTLDMLQRSFNDAAAQALAANDAPGSLMSNLRSLVRVRKVGDQQGGDDQAILARGESKLGRGDVQGALAELQTLSPSSAAAMASWLAKAQAYQQAHAALHAMQLALAGEESAPASP